MMGKIHVHYHGKTSDAAETSLWKYNKITGYWVFQRKCDESEAPQYLKIFQSDEPKELFKLSKNKPSGKPTGDHRLDFVTPATDAERRDRIQQVVRNCKVTSAVALRWLEAEEWVVDTCVRELKHAMRLGFTVDSPTAGQLAECKRLVSQLAQIIDNETFKRRKPEEAEKVRQLLREAYSIANS